MSATVEISQQDGEFRAVDLETGGTGVGSSRAMALAALAVELGAAAEGEDDPRYHCGDSRDAPDGASRRRTSPTRTSPRRSNGPDRSSPRYERPRLGTLLGFFLTAVGGLLGRLFRL